MKKIEVRARRVFGFEFGQVRSGQGGRFWFLQGRLSTSRVDEV